MVMVMAALGAGASAGASCPFLSRWDDVFCQTSTVGVVSAYIVRTTDVRRVLQQ